MENEIDFSTKAKYELKNDSHTSLISKIFTIPHSTLATEFLTSKDNTQHSWVTTIAPLNIIDTNINQAITSTLASIIAPAQRSQLTTTIEGGNSNRENNGDSFLLYAITGNPSDTEQLNDNYSNRAGRGGGVGVSCGGESPPTPTVGKTLLNTNANLLPITTASDTFNNLKNLVKIDKVSPLSGVGGNNTGGNGYRSKGNGGGINGNSGYRNNNSNNNHSSPPGGRGNNHASSNNGTVGTSGRTGGATTTAPASSSSSNFSTGYNKNSVKIRQYDSEVSPRPRRSYQGDSSSSRYYTKNSDILGHAGGQSGGSTGNGSNNNTGRALNIHDSTSGGRSGAPNANENGRRISNGYQGTPSDGGYNRNLNAQSSGSGSGSYRQQQNSRYDNNVNGNNAGGGSQQRQYGNGNGGYNNFNNKSYSNNRGSNDNNVNSRSNSHRDHDYGGGGSSNNYRDFDDSTVRSNRYISGGNSNNNSSGSNNNGSGGGYNSNSLERRYKPNNNEGGSGLGGGNSTLPPSALRQGQGLNEVSNSNAYERNSGNYADKRNQNHRGTPPLRGSSGSGSGSGSGNASSNFINSNTSSRGASPNNSSSPSSSARQQQQTPPVSTTPPPAAGRWVPPSLRPQHGLTQSEKNDAVFRKVRGILNKLTPEKFQELSDELLKLDLNSIQILNGVILLIFDKALDEPKYSSMYAQLCKRLSEEAPSFEKEQNSLCTFLRLLIAVCRDKFNNRLKRDEENETIAIKISTSSSTENNNETDEEERRHLAKQRMLGNVKFIGELNKLDMLSKSVLHQCIVELLDKKKKRTATSQEMCEDMECLAQLLKTCGKNLDSEQGKELMNLYFETLERRSKSIDYPPRIRFMLKDVIELRENNWVPRKVATTEGPVPIKQIRTDDDTIIRTPFAQQQRQRDMRNNDRDGDSWMNRFHLNLQPGGFNDMFSGLSVTGASPLVSPFAPTNNNNNRYNNNRERNQNQNYNNNRYNKYNNQNGSGNGSGGHRDHRDDMRGGGGSGGNQHNRDRDNSGGQLNSNKELAPRFKRNLMCTNQDSVENLQMRPAANSLLFKAASQNQKIPTMLPISTPPTPFGNGNAAAAAQSKENSLQNSQYPLLGTPTTSHLTNPARPSSTPSAEYDGNKHSHGTNLDVGSNGASHLEKGLKATSSSPNFGSALGATNGGSELNGADKDGNHNGGNNKATTQLITKHGSIEKPGPSGAPNAASNKQKKDKAFNKEEVLKKSAAFIKEKFFYTEDEDIEEEIVPETVVVEATNEVKTEGETETKTETETETKVEAETETETVVVVPTSSIPLSKKQFRSVIEGFNDLKVPEKCMKDVCIAVVMEVLDKGEEQYLERVIQFLTVLRKEFNMKPNIVLEMFKQVVNKMNERETLNSRIVTHVAILLAKAVGEAGLLKINDIANYTDNGQHYPLFLLVLQQLHKTIGKEALAEKFNGSKIDLLNSLPEVDRNKTRLAEILDERNLAFLYPLLKVQAEMLKQLTADPNPTAFYKWIKSNVDAKYYKDAGFISALMTVVLKYITNETSLSEGTDIKKHPEKAVIEKEEMLLNKYCQILQTFFGQDMDLQLIAVYALQVFCFNENFPKGMLCRWFKYLYEASVIEEETFIKWKEEISDKYPGKGSALFQVNSWLTWLQEAESEDDDD